MCTLPNKTVKIAALEIYFKLNEYIYSFWTEIFFGDFVEELLREN